MLLRLTKRLIVEPDKRVLWKMLYNMGYRGVHSVRRHKRRLKRGEYFPAFLYLSITNGCNLRCQGCWVDVTAEQHDLSLEAMNRLISEAKEMGVFFFGILGGEPFMHPQLMDLLGVHPDCYFQVFTNGHFLTDEVCQELRRLANVSPLVSIEGNEEVSDERRGRPKVFSMSMEGLQRCAKHGLMAGVCTSVCQSNFEDLVNEEWLDRLIEAGAFYVWYYVYRPAGPDPHPELALTREQQTAVRRFVVEMRPKKPIIFIDSYHDHEGVALCPAVSGLSHHISPWGDIEPCPVVQFAGESIDDGRPLRQVFQESVFLRDFRGAAASATRGCILLERPDLLQEVVEKHGARDTTARKTALAELEAITPGPSQHDPGNEVAERSWLYRLAKRFWFNDFGVYAKLKE